VAFVNERDTRQTDFNIGSNCGWWWRRNPTSGSKTILVTIVAVGALTGGSASFSGASGEFNLGSPQKATFGPNINPSTLVDTAPGEWVVDVISVSLTGLPTAVVGAGQTQIFNRNNGSGSSIGAGSDEASTGIQTTMNWTGLTSLQAGSGQVCVSLRPLVPYSEVKTKRMSLQQRLGND
jgi:hypothetical protein